MTATCGHPKADGTPCPTPFALCDDCGLCYHHCDHRAEERAAARAKGGKVSGTKQAEAKRRAHGDAKYAATTDEVPNPPTNAVEAKAYLAWLLDQGSSSKMGSARARDMAQVCKLFIDAVKVADLETDVEKMRGEMAEIKKARAGR